MKHSPSPWTHNAFENLGCHNIYSSDGEEICFTSGLADERMEKSNTCLLAASAEMFDLLMSFPGFCKVQCVGKRKIWMDKLDELLSKVTLIDRRNIEEDEDEDEEVTRCPG